MNNIIVAPCDYNASKYACENYHYSKSMPAGRIIGYGVWQDNEYYGAILFGLGSCYRIGKPFGLKQGEICELVRIALKPHRFFVSFVLMKAIKQLSEHSKKLKIIVSYADTRQGHLGKIYQATNWIYLGIIKNTGKKEYYYNGKWIHSRTYQKSKFYKSLKNIPYRIASDKYKYAYPLDKNIKKNLIKNKKEYPKKNEAINVETEK